MSQAQWFLNPLFGKSYAEKVRGYNPITHWMLAEPVGVAVAYDEVTDPGHIDTGRSGDHTAVGLGQAGIGDGLTCPLYDGATSYTDIYTASLNAAFSGAFGTFISWVQVSGGGVWTDGSTRIIAGLFVDASNLFYVRRSNVNNTLNWRFTAGGTGTIRSKAGLSTTGWMCLGLTWGGGSAQAYYNGAPEGGSWAIGAWAGNLNANACVIGAANVTPANIFDGYVAHCALFTTKLSTQAMADLAAV